MYKACISSLRMYSIVNKKMKYCHLNKLCEHFKLTLELPTKKDYGLTF